MTQGNILITSIVLSDHSETQWKTITNYNVTVAGTYTYYSGIQGKRCGSDDLVHAAVPGIDSTDHYEVGEGSRIDYHNKIPDSSWRYVETMACYAWQTGWSCSNKLGDLFTDIWMYMFKTGTPDLGSFPGELEAKAAALAYMEFNCVDTIYVHFWGIPFRAVGHT